MGASETLTRIRAQTLAASHADAKNSGTGSVKGLGAIAGYGSHTMTMNSHPHDSALRRLLHESWTVEIRPNPSFRAEVWARIAALKQSPETWFSWLKIHLVGVGMASAASFAVAITGAGLFAQNQVQREQEKLVSRYVASIDPHARVGFAADNP